MSEPPRDHRDPPQIPAGVIVADDRPARRGALVRAIEGMRGVTLLGEVGTVAQTLELASCSRPAVVTTCSRLPDGTVSTLCRALKQSGVNARVVVASDDRREASVMASLASGVGGYLVVPATIEMIAFALHTVVRGSGPYLDPRIAHLVVNLALRWDRTKGPYGLTRSEVRVLALIVGGYTNPRIATELGLSTNTIKSHVRAILGKLEVSNRREAARVASVEHLV